LFTFVSDMFLAAADTSSHTTAFFLYHLARTPEEQDKLADVAVRGPLTSRAELTPFIKFGGSAALRESLRLNPVSVGVSRFVDTDVALSTGHVAPAGSLLINQAQVVCRMEEYFYQPNAFLPSRWKRGL
jgi:cytochrome P450